METLKVSKMKKSIAIIGKGPSVLKSTKELVDSFDEVAICNWPPFDGYEQYIGSRATYHFINAGDTIDYERNLLDNLGLKKFFNTQANGNYIQELPDNILPCHDVEYEWDFGIKTREKYETKYGIWPSTGIMAFDHFLNCDDFNTITLIGFDFYEAGKSVYYFPKEKAKDSIHYLWNNDSYSIEGTVLDKAYQSHGGNKIIKIINDLIEKSDKKIIWVK